jgi:hypothetical protein
VVPVNLACRGCRVRVDANGGCALCSPLKRNLVAIDEDRDESPALSEVGSETVAALRSLLRTARRDLEAKGDGPAAKRARALAPDRIVKVGNSLAKVLEAARKLQGDGISAIQAMSFVERAELFLSWYAALPPPYREHVREGQAKMELERSAPVALPAGAA